MNTFRKSIIVTLAGVIFGCIGILPATANTSEVKSADQRPVKEWSTFYLKATTQDGKVYLNWSSVPAKTLESGWNYWKVVRSTSNNKPVYPDDGYIRYDGDRLGFTSYVDENPESVATYYRVCAITNAARYCSNVVKVPGIQKNINPQKVEQIPAPSNQDIPALSLEIRTKIDQIVENLQQALDAKFGTEDIKKVDWLNTKIAQVSALKKKAPAIIEYLVSRLIQLQNSYRNTIIPTEIQDLLNVE